MSAIKFNHVFILLMLISALAAFVIPERYVVRAQPQVQGLFMPVASPVRSAAGWVHQRVARPESPDVRDARALAADNDALRQRNLMLEHALEELQRIHVDRAKLGRVLEACTIVKVVAPDAGTRQSLQIQGSTLDGIADGMFVLHTGGVAGRISRPPGLMGAQVRLITDRGMRVTASFRRITKGPDGSLSRRVDTPAAVVEGTGDGAMRCLGLTMEEVTKAGLAPGDWAVVEDRDWDERVHGNRLGRVTSIRPQISAPLFAEIRVEPARNLLRLRDVMVLSK